MNDILTIEHSLMGDLFDIRFMNDVYAYGIANEGLADGIKSGAGQVWNSKFVGWIRRKLGELFKRIADIFGWIAGIFHPKFKPDAQKGIKSRLKQAGLEVLVETLAKWGLEYLKDAEGLGAMAYKFCDRLLANPNKFDVDAANAELEGQISKVRENMHHGADVCADAVEKVQSNIEKNYKNSDGNIVEKTAGFAKDTAKDINDTVVDIISRNPAGKMAIAACKGVGEDMGGLVKKVEGILPKSDPNKAEGLKRFIKNLTDVGTTSAEAGKRAKGGIFSFGKRDKKAS